MTRRNVIVAFSFLLVHRWLRAYALLGFQNSNPGLGSCCSSTADADGGESVGGEGKPLEKSERRTVLGDVPESNGFYGVDIIRMPFDFRDDDAVEDVQNEPKGTVIIIDPFCEFLGKKLSAIVRMRGYATVEILSDYLLKGLGAEEELSHLGVPSPGDERRWANGLPPVAGVISESDAGLGTAERLQVALDAWCSNGIHEARRNKLEMSQVAQKCGLHTARQRLVSSWGEARPFLEDELGILPLNKMEGAAAEKMCVLKPVRGCSSQNVVRCSSLEEAEEAFAFLLGKQQYGGGHIEQILVQGFLEGQEYAVDTVSCDGQHKVVGLWKYDKRPANGAPFVYHSTQLVPAKGEVEQRVLDYVVEVLDALEIQYGPAHTEVIVTDQGPALVEVNGRWHLADVAPLTRACVGRDAVALSADALLPECREAFHDAGPDGVLPSATAGEEPVRVIAYRGYPMSFQRHGMIVHLVCGVEGELERVDHLGALGALGTALAVELFPEFAEPGARVTKTVDIKTDAGAVTLLADSLEELERDYATILDLQKSMFVVRQESSGGGY